jgi:hypothetical protein
MHRLPYAGSTHNVCDGITHGMFQEGRDPTVPVATEDIAARRLRRCDSRRIGLQKVDEHPVAAPTGAANGFALRNLR